MSRRACVSQSVAVPRMVLQLRAQLCNVVLADLSFFW